MRKLFGFFLILFGVVLLSAQPAEASDFDKNFSSIIVIDDFGANIIVTDVDLAPDFDVGLKHQAIFNFNYNQDVTISWQESPDKSATQMLDALPEDIYSYKPISTVTATLIQFKTDHVKLNSYSAPTFDNNQYAWYQIYRE